MDVPVLYSDEHLLAVDKPPRVLVVPAPGRSGPTVVDVVQDQVGGRVYAVHRLDEDTTGVLVLARTLEAKLALEDIFRAHGATRIYLAIVGRAPSPAAGRIESLLRENVAGVVKSALRGSGKRAVTHYKMLRRDGRRVLLECRPETGRRNQIRVHLAEIGCPILGDRKYGYRSRGGSGPKRPLLHASEIQLIHPMTGEDLVIRAAAPASFTVS